MMTTPIKSCLRAVGSKTQTPTQYRAIAHAGRRLARPIAVLVGSAVICSSLAMTAAWTTADAQGQAGGALQRARKNAEQRRAATDRFAKPAERAAAQRAKEQHHLFLNTLKRAESAAAQRVKEQHHRR
jgi:hypothetical protein